ncbi:Ste24 endopeptidase [Desulfonatronospira thiodismutans ASO3-1]|uniref:Ste24 endopeptidase n=1 Tax=Desulfonatronospira thiodismutans ASO3-1 TaxID=555779 RepID=D6SM34_9BACT|nr:M48 family metallopeptidase [Desulfonatronospira thiodismutans]EFI35745.1 Ste24 endopeptidase [Desulfonatronospira thiodismutans ASO3-1]
MQTIIFLGAAALLAARACWQTVLAVLNRTRVLSLRHHPPESVFRVMDRETYDKSVDYTLAKNRFELWSIWYGTVILAVLLFSGIVPWFYHNLFESGSELHILNESLFLAAVYVVFFLAGLPLDFYSSFRLEERFGFNKSTMGLWISDQFKSLVIALVITVPLLSLIIWLIIMAGSLWWVWAFALVSLFQLVMMVLYPMLILPLFNRLTPLPDEELRQRLMNLADRAGFKARTIQVMDGSKRSGHSNAFFTGFGRFRRIVFFDTLIEQLEPRELEAVLAHEIGHYKKGHVPRMLAISAAMFLAGFALAAWLLETPAFIQAFGFQPEHAGPGPALLLFALLAGVVAFWLSPLMGALSRKHEYQADSFAAKQLGDVQPMIRALTRLGTENLANLTPHPLYSGFYYSHPTLMERIGALEQAAEGKEKAPPPA